MTTEEKAKAYDEALEKAKKYMNDGYTVLMPDLFPELKDNEDKRIINQLIDLIQNTGEVVPIPNNRDELLDYLEKQKKPDGAWTEEDDAKVKAMCEEGDLKPSEREWLKNLKNRIVKKEQKPIENARDIHNRGYAKGVEDAYNNVNEAKIILKRLAKENPKSTDWNEDYREEYLRTRFAFYTYKDENDVLYLSNVFVEETSRNKGFGTKILAAAEKVAETIGATNILLKVKQNSPANTWYRKHGYKFMALEEDYDWLKKTLEYQKPSKQEWSEEDEEHLNSIIESYKELLKDYSVNHGVDYIPYNTPVVARTVLNDIEFLKSLRSQPKQDVLPSLSEKEIICLKRTLDYLRKEHNCYDGEDFTNEIAVLELLITHPILVSDTHWKPSEEQIEALKYTLGKGGTYNKEVLNSLLTDLQN